MVVADSYATGERCQRCNGYLLNTDERCVRYGFVYHAWCLNLLRTDPVEVFLRRHEPHADGGG